MANFPQHLLFGLTTSSVCSLAGYFQFGLTPVQSGASVVVGTLASLAPDLDHPESIPGKLFFEILGVLVPILAITQIPPDYLKKFVLEHWILYFCCSYLFAKYLLFDIFAKITVHRGVFHSIPAALICGELTFLMFGHLSVKNRITIAIIGMIGYFTHLIADEVYSIDWEGSTLKKSFGTAMDFGKLQSASTWIAYCLLLGLARIIYRQII